MKRISAWAITHPVFPLVLSRMVRPGARPPDRSPSSIMRNAGRSLTEPPGLRNSALPRIVHPVSSEARRSLISGVLPTVPIKPSRIFIPFSVSELAGQDYRRREQGRNTPAISAASPMA